jgi:hypothetical protein
MCMRLLRHVKIRRVWGCGLMRDMFDADDADTRPPFLPSHLDMWASQLAHNQGKLQRPN